VTVNDAGRAPFPDAKGGQSDQLIQLLTPEGERVEHPEYPLEISTDEIKALGLGEFLSSTPGIEDSGRPGPPAGIALGSRDCSGVVGYLSPALKSPLAPAGAATGSRAPR